MPSWEETKRAAQTAFIGGENGSRDVHESIGNAYRQILITGHIYATQGKDSLTQQIAEDSFRQPEPEHDEKLFYLSHFHRSEQEPEQGMEPER